MSFEAVPPQNLPQGVPERFNSDIVYGDENGLTKRSTASDTANNAHHLDGDTPFIPSGTVTITQGSAVVTVTAGIDFKAINIDEDTVVIFNADAIDYVVKSVDSAAQITLTTAITQVSSTSATIQIKPTIFDIHTHPGPNNRKVMTVDHIGFIQLFEDVNIGLVGSDDESLFLHSYGANDNLIEAFPFSHDAIATEATPVFDHSPVGNDGVTKGGVTINNTLGKYGNGASFDGVNETAIVVPANTRLTEVDDLSFDAWVKVTSGSEGFMDIISKTDIASPVKGWEFAISANGLRFIIRNNGTTHDTFNRGIGLIRNGEWNHLAFTFDVTTHLSNLYINGINVDKDRDLTAAYTDSGKDLLLGARFNSTQIQAVLNGQMAQPKLYNRILKRAEIRNSYLRHPTTGAAGIITANNFRIVDTGGTVVFDPKNVVPLHAIRKETGTTVKSTDTGKPLVFYYFLSNVAARTFEIQTVDITENAEFIVKDMAGTATTANITITTQASETIDGETTKIINADDGFFRFKCFEGNVFTV